jgi:hypothetical protein
MIRLIDAEILKLRRRTGMLVMVALLSIGAVAGYDGVTAAMGNEANFGDIVAILALSGSVIGVIVGATAGAADIEAGVFRDLVATGRPRLSLFLARVPGACAIVLPALTLAVLGAALLSGGGAVGLALAQVLGSGALAATVCVGLAALTGSRGTVIGLALAFQLGVSPMLGQWEAIGDGRFAIPMVSLARLGGGADDIGLAVGAALAILLAWAAVALAAGAWRSTTQEI